MDNIEYVGELIWLGELGRASIFLAFATALLSAFAYCKANNTKLNSWKKIGRIAFVTHGLSILTIVGVIFYLMINRNYEYRYVLEHVSDDLPMRYIFSAFWEGQEGSFLLWMFWHVILGFVFMRIKSPWENGVMCILAIIEAFLISMLLGVYIGWGDWSFKLGSNPLLLLRETMDLPLFANAEYKSLLQGDGLNPLLQNYWMTIHPPTLFLGFASTSIPFCFAIAGLWERKHKEWLAPALRWSLFSAAILGIGILMGGAWAYEALSFGGYWAWDPVENASLVPWLILIAGIHTNLIAKATGYSIRSTYVFYLLTFILIVYSTFLTRSGILGDTSVHAFTEMGLEWQLVGFLGLFTLLGFSIFAFRYKDIPAPSKEESFSSREFWMFIGSLVLLFSGVLINGSTSLPVLNKLVQYFDPSFVGRVIEDPIPHYNKYQVWIGVFVALLSSVALFMRYGHNDSKRLKGKLLKHMGVSLLLALLATFVFVQYLELYSWQYYVLMFTSAFAVAANIDYLITALRGNLKLGASALSHAGFGLMIIGVLASGLNQSTISSNPFAFKGILEDNQVGKSIKLYKGLPMFMSNYWVTYENDTIVGNERTYTINMRKVDKNENTVEEFDLHPSVLYNKNFTKVASANPSTKHYWSKDIFTDIDRLPSALLDVKFAHEMEDTLKYDNYLAAIGDTIYGRRCYGILRGLDFNPAREEFDAEANDIGIGLDIEFKKLDEDEAYRLMPIVGLQGNLVYQYPDNADPLNLKIKLKDSLLNILFSPESELNYSTIELNRMEPSTYSGMEMQIVGFDDNPSNEGYVKRDTDIAIGAEVKIKLNNREIRLNPIYVIRGNQPYIIKDYDAESGVHIKMVNIDPQSEMITLEIARDRRENFQIPFEIAENVARTDFIVFRAREFPGINFFWLGTILMMLGLLVAFLRRYRLQS